jgi:sugar diacid utilization regulator
LTVVASANDAEAVGYAVEGAGIRSALTHHDGLTIAILSGPTQEADPLGSISELIAEGGQEPILGAGRPGVGPSGLRRSLREALTALTLARARPDGARVVGHLDVGSHVLLLDLVEQDVLEAFRETLLGPIERWDAEHATDLMATLHAFLQHDGAWRSTAAHLHIHHNTLRHRIERIENLTGRRVATTSDRVDLHLALSIAAAT